MPKNAENSPLACGPIELKEEDILEIISYEGKGLGFCDQ